MSKPLTLVAIDYDKLTLKFEGDFFEFKGEPPIITGALGVGSSWDEYPPDSTLYFCDATEVTQLRDENKRLRALLSEKVTCRK